MSEQTTVETALVAMRSEYDALVDQGERWSLRTLFSTPDRDIDDYCRDFRPNRFGEYALAEVENFCRRHRIWLDSGGAHYNSMTPYLHPNAVTADRMTIIGIFNAILFWLNDTVGREKFAHLSAAEQLRAAHTAGRLRDMLETRSPAADPTPEEVATAEFLDLLARDAEPAWLDQFLGSTAEHLRTAIRDQNTDARGDLLSVTDYIDLRSEVSGMYPAIAMCEFGRDDYLPWDLVRADGQDEKLRRLRKLTAEIGALMNDVFSFEKECIADGADFNLIPVWLLNTPGATLSDAVHGSARIVRDRLTEFYLLSDQVLAAYADTDLPAAESVAAHLRDLVGCVQATWAWQIVTPRYKGVSIFEENHAA
ncbi:terpene synthase family protein [Nocardia macrotermitis]|uniref:terpene synthase family protein n=1 Tax=Nocardia macrotermitis TaxID=2585198 RepID=UPI0029E8156C|nr:terpene synthase family protein [Nocardia macrotermitis]